MLNVPLDRPASAARLRRIQKARRRRESIFGAELFRDPAWDILLELYASELEHVRTSVTDVCNASGAPATTMLRWIRRLENEGWVVRAHDSMDKRRMFLELSRRGSSFMDEYFREYGHGLPL